MQIGILRLAPERIRSVQVTGSPSGRHPGRLQGYSERRGASFALHTRLSAAARSAVCAVGAGGRALRRSRVVGAS